MTPTPRATTAISASNSITPSATITATTPVTSAAPAPTSTRVGVGALSAAETGPLTGTIIANRTESSARFFVEGMTFVLEPEASQGLDLPRPSSVLNLFNCDAALAENTSGCFWDPYVIQLDGFYEIYSTPGANGNVKLLLQEAGTPPRDQVWLQNRTGRTESVVFRDEIYELTPTEIVEFPVTTDAPAILYVRNCISVDNQSVCEWNPITLNAGVYYALLEIETPGSEPGSLLTAVDVRPVVNGEAASVDTGEATTETTPADTGVVSTSSTEITCSLAVPVLNIRSGPGLQYEIIGKIRADDDQTATVAVDGRSADYQWLTVSESSGQPGWITASESFITCQNDISLLPLVEAPAPPPTPVPSIVEQPPVTDGVAPFTGVTDTSDTSDTGDSADGTEAEAEPTPQPSSVSVPPGMAVLVVNNGFQHQMRFTIDQIYRPEEGPSEYDLEPGQSVSIVVFPGQIAFTASSPWNGLSGNASISVATDQSIPLWLRFEPDDSGSWNLRWQ